ncbi:hypothetical protein QCA50_000182 [Cerrena zonata]|uniref:JmjC domain-containing protein n=1 Tax=Cerrena zonata TaxID=2478898 RepID=A0AAW0GSC7_9APHY
MNLHDQAHNKRTSIDQLLNPVASQQAAPLDPRSVYPPNQLPNMPPPNVAYLPPNHQQHVSAPPSYPPSMQQPGSFRLSAASWDQGAEERVSPRHHELDSSASCRYQPAGPSSVHSHPSYPEQPYPRQLRQGESQPEQPTEYPNLNVQPTWSPPQDPPPVQYNGHNVVPPSYSSEQRNGGESSSASMSGTWSFNAYTMPGSSNDASKSYSPQYEHPEYPPQGFPPGYVPVLMANPNSRGPLPPHPAMAQAQQRGGQLAPPHAYYGPPTIAYVALQPIAPVPAPKRPLESSPEEEPVPKKKPRAKKTNGETPTSRRGYNAKKRNEAAQIAAQNALGSMVSFKPAAGENATDAASEGVSAGEGMPKLHPELQFARCMSNRYRSEEFPRCVSCTRRWAGDTCRFQGIRFFLKDENRNILGISFVESQKPDGPSMSFPLQWNIPLHESHMLRVKRTVAKALLPILRAEREHLKRPEVIRRPRESEVRATCDTCMTSIFSCTWMCRNCGREACAECFEQVEELTTDRVGANDAEIVALQAKREKHAHINPFFLSCTRRSEHRARDFSPMSRFSKDELSQAIAEMEALLAKGDPDAIGPPIIAKDIDITLGQSPEVPNEPTEQNGSSSSASPTASTAPSNPLPYDAPVPTHPVQVFEDSILTDDVFRKVWIKGEPLVVTGLLHKFQLQWTPEYFRTKYGNQNCLILECQSDQNKRVTVGEFFSWFGDYEGRRDCWKLKDWPPSTDFKTAFPELYDDFNRAVPVPNYVRRDGVLNIASHFPSNTVAPDLGPKMYNAMASYESQGSKGTTRLHMDMADAINIMLYSSQTPTGQPGCAAWDLFRAEDAQKLRRFLRKKFKGQYQHDPIHSQQFYMDSDLRRELYNDYGVKSFRIYQKPGEAVFIPAGCAHQVCNLSDSIKVACDFVSPENIGRCETLTREFREQNQSMAWKEDVLQLRSMMWFSWLSCVRQEKEQQGQSDD